MSASDTGDPGPPRTNTTGTSTTATVANRSAPLARMFSTSPCLCARSPWASSHDRTRCGSGSRTTSTSTSPATLVETPGVASAATAASLLNPLAVALHARRSGDQGTLEDTRLAVAALHQAVATESLYGAAFRRSAGIAGADATEPSAQLSWWARQLETALGLPQGGGSGLK